ncbi:hypothetical protein GGF41_001023 [Coemansia sp. RSA 2531]|nr:hypothetical protein GGF41_001023 [Coemansia sp. RSA 2531]
MSRLNATAIVRDGTDGGGSLWAAALLCLCLPIASALQNLLAPCSAIHRVPVPMLEAVPVLCLVLLVPASTRDWQKGLPL